MEIYQHLLLAADFSEHGDRVARRAQSLAAAFQAELTILHVVDNLPIADSTYGPVIPYDVDLTEELVAAARQRLAKLAETLGVPEERRLLELGRAKVEIVRIAEERRVDLIVVGSHGRHGIGLLLGSTATSVMHHAKCDVLAVRMLGG